MNRYEREGTEVSNWKEAVAQWDQDQLRCRAYRHAWTDYTVEAEKRHYVVTQQCSRCGSLRRMTLSPRGKVVKPWAMVEYSEGYLIKGLGFQDPEAKDRIRAAALGLSLRNES